MRNDLSKIIWPNLFLAGVPRAGTTAVYAYLRQHPDIFMTPSKEPGFFAVDGALFDLEDRHKRQQNYFLTTIDDYQALFRHWQSETVIGDATPHYIYHRRVAERIAHYCPDAKIIIILRNPAERMHSHYMMDIRDGGKKGEFQTFVRKALAERTMPPPLHNSLYAPHLNNFLAVLEEKNIRVILYEDFAANPQALMKSLYQFLAVDTAFQPEIVGQPNRSGVPRSRIAHRLVMKSLNHRLMRQIHLRGSKDLGNRMESARNRYFDRWVKKEVLDGDECKALNRAIFREDIEKLQALIQRDLSHWLD